MLSGRIKVRECGPQDEVLFVMHDLKDRVRLINHSHEANLLFAATVGGQFSVYKLPVEWEPAWLEQKVREIRASRGSNGFKNW
jgi:hypothetical protein